MATKVFFLNSNSADYGEEEFNYLQKFLLEAGVLTTQGADWNDFVDLKVSQNGTPDMSVNVAIGNAVMETVRNLVTFKVFVSNLAIVNLAIANNTSGLDRVDAIIVKISRTAEPNALMSNIATIEVVSGSGATALSDNDIQTAIGADYDFLRLANITVVDSETTILDADIEDTRVRVLTSDSVQYSPSVMKFRYLTADPSSPVEGELWYNSTDNVLRYYDGTSVINIQASTYLGGNGIDITSGIVSLDLADESGMEFNGGKLRLKGGQRIMIAGENINGGDLPIPVYLSADHKVYKCQANNSSKLFFIGFAVSNALTDENIIIQTNGIVSGFSALNYSEYYYVQDTAGIIDINWGTNRVIVGKSISATEIEIVNPWTEHCVVSDNIRISSDSEGVASYADPAMVKSSVINRTGSVRLTFDAKYVNDWLDSYTNIYVNGNIVADLTGVTPSYQTFSFDINNLKPNDVISVGWTQDPGYGTRYLYVKNWRIKFNEI